VTDAPASVVVGVRSVFFAAEHGRETGMLRRIGA